jgi:DNA-binding IclR family transcriptional regulator
MLIDSLTQSCYDIVYSIMLNKILQFDSSLPPFRSAKNSVTMINSVRKAIRVLRLFSASEPRLTLAQVSERLGMPKSSAHNLLNTLVADDFVEKIGRDQYALGTAILPLTQAIRVNVEVRDPAAPLLRQLADASRESAYLTVRDGNHVLYIYAVESPQRLVARTAIGERAQMHCTSVGKAILAFLEETEVATILEQTGSATYTDTTLTDPWILREELASIRKQGYSLDNSEHEEGVYCIGAPIFNGNGLVQGACSISGIDPEIVGNRCPDLSTLVVGTAQRISRYLGYVPNRMSAVNELTL